MSETSFSNLSNEELRQELNKNGIAYGPILANTRKVYEKKLQNMLEGKVNLDDNLLLNGVEKNMDNGIAMNGNARTPSREVSPIMELPKQNSEESRNEEQQMREISPRLVTNKEEDSDDEEDASENTRVLTPEEVRSFQSGLIHRYSESPSKNVSSNANIRQRREMSTPSKNAYLGHGISNSVALSTTSSKLKRYGMPIVVMFVFICMIASGFYFREHLPFTSTLQELPNMFKRLLQEREKTLQYSEELKPSG